MILKAQYWITGIYYIFKYIYTETIVLNNNIIFIICFYQNNAHWWPEVTSFKIVNKTFTPVVYIATALLLMLYTTTFGCTLRLFTYWYNVIWLVCVMFMLSYFYRSKKVFIHSKIKLLYFYTILKQIKHFWAKSESKHCDKVLVCVG